MLTQRRPLRIACFGFAEEHSGSVSSANFLILRELLKRGHQVDFFNKRSFLYPEALTKFANFRYVDTDNPIGAKITGWFLKLSNPVNRFIAGRINDASFTRVVIRTMRREHRAKPYDLQLFLGTTSYGRIEGIRTVSWVQGPPMTDGYSVYKHRAKIIALCGRLYYWPLQMFAWCKGLVGLPDFRQSDVIICGSRWACTQMEKFGVNAGRLHGLPYPIDLQEFIPAPKEATDGFHLLWLGRIVPRKRLDLFLDAAEILIARGLNLRVTVIGGFPFARGFQKLIDRFRYPQRMNYAASIDRREVRALMQTVDVVVQPSESENFASTPAEALACGVPVVLGPTNGTRDYTDGAAIVFDRYDAASVADAVNQMLDLIRQNPKEVADRSRAAAERHFQLAGIVDQLEAILYATVLSNS